MDYAIRTERGHLVVELTGIPTSGEVVAMFRDLARQTTAQAEPLRALLELRMPRCLSFPDTLLVIAAIPALGFAPSSRVALHFSDEHARVTAEFAETVAANRGIPLRAFDALEPALRWLES